MASAICPIIKTTESLYRGGLSAEADDEPRCQCKIDNVDYVFDEIPLKLGLKAFSLVRGSHDKSNGVNDDINDDNDDVDIVSELKSIDKLHELETRKSIKDLIKYGSAEIIDRQTLVSKYGASDKNMRNVERNIVKRIRELTE